MSATEYENLKSLREQLVRLRIDTVASQSGLSATRIREIEEGDEPTVCELELLAAAYGLDVETLWDSPIRLAQGDGVELLPSLEEFRDLNDIVRARILRAAAAARDLVTVQRKLGVDVPALPTLPRPDARDTPYRQGASLAKALRAELNLGVDPIASVRDLVAERLPSVAVLHADLSRNGPAGVSFADRFRGPVVVLNTVGKNEHPAVRRFSLSHELCHLLADWNRADPLASISGFFSEADLVREQRANGFAIRLLCPETVVHRLRPYREEDAARVLLNEYGLHYSAARLYLRNEAGMHLPVQPPRELAIFAEPDATQHRNEAPRGVLDFPLEGAPVVRRGPLAETVVRAWAAGLFSRDAAARYLGVTPGDAIERVADYFAVDLPPEAATG
jgi:Zn-dependent peptidase ImmA (M78 family)/transcriptional regulator with XRE-family HTH domain